MDGSEADANSPIPLNLLDAGDPAFVAALRGVADAGALAQFAAPWHADARPSARALLFAYLDQPPNAPGHEGLIKRLFKLAEAASDDEVMARFLILTDQLIMRRRPAEDRHLWEDFATLEEAQARGTEWIARGYRDVSWSTRLQVYVNGKRWYPVTGHYPRTTIATGDTTLPRPDWREGEALAALNDEERARRRWFPVATRRYLQRRAWRYFRRLGRADAGRYLAAAEVALGLYRDDELADGLALLDHLGLMRLLFGASPALRFRASGCDLAIGHTLPELAPSPAFASAWHEHPAAVLRVLTQARAAVVARWAVRWIEAGRARFLDAAPPAAWVGLLDRDDPAVVGLALGMLEALPVDRIRREVDAEAWIKAAEEAAPAHQEAVCGFSARVVEPAAVPRADAVRLALVAAEPPARLGWGWLTAPGRADETSARELFPLVNAACPSLRPAILAGVGQHVEATPLRAEWTRILLTSRHADARARGLAQLEQGLRADPTLWAELVESPHPDVQAWCATRAEAPAGAAPARRDGAWAAVLLRPSGMARAKPAAIRRVVARLDGLTDDDAEAVELIALLVDVARSPHAPERRAALAALVGLATRRPGWAGRIEGAVPALQIGE